MTPRLASGFSAGLARLIGLARAGRRSRPAAQRHDPAPAAAAPSEAAARSRYVTAPPLLRCLGGWSVRNRASRRVIAAGLSRRQAETLRRLLDLACSWSRYRRTDVVHRHEEK